MNLARGRTQLTKQRRMRLTVRRLGLKAGSGLRRGFEVGLLILVVLPIVPFGLKGVDFIANNPISVILVPVLSVVAYVWMCKRKITVAESDVPSIR